MCFDVHYTDGPAAPARVYDAPHLEAEQTLISSLSTASPIGVPPMITQEPSSDVTDTGNAGEHRDSKMKPLL